MHTPIVTVDFETHPILPRPQYPPVPVGVAVLEGRKAHYYAFGHTHGNNTSRADVERRLIGLWYSARCGDIRLLFHHAAFDLCVARERFGLDLLPAEAYEDTLPLAFLATPDAPALGLKPLAKKLLDMEPVERDAVQTWLKQHDPESRKSITARRARVAYAPGGLVGQYAQADVRMTRALFDHLHDLVVREYGMLEPYMVEKRLVVEVLLDMEARGVAVAGNALVAASSAWESSLVETDVWLRRRLRSPGLNLDARDDLADALEKAGELDEWMLTAKGGRSTAVDDLELVLHDPTLVAAFDYRARLAFSLRTFVRPWTETLAQTDERRIFTTWHPIRGAETGKARGARTGRLSSTPNLQNIGKRIPDIVNGKLLKHRATPRSVALRLPKGLWQRSAALPALRDFILPFDPAGCLIAADYSQQELRILAHYAGGALRELYNAQPDVDLHSHARDLLAQAGYEFDRSAVKTTSFGIIYGLGVAKLAEKIGADTTTARRLKLAYKGLFPGLPELESELRRIGQTFEEFHTWGGRRYVCEAPVVVGNAVRTWEYKLINTLIQGSAGDVLKHALLALNTALAGKGVPMLTVHDEVVVSTDARSERAQKDVARTVKKALESVKFTVPMPVDVKIGPTWSNMTKVVL